MPSSPSSAASPAIRDPAGTVQGPLRSRRPRAAAAGSGATTGGVTAASAERDVFGE